MPKEGQDWRPFYWKAEETVQEFLALQEQRFYVRHPCERQGLSIRLGALRTALTYLWHEAERYHPHVEVLELVRPFLPCAEPPVKRPYRRRVRAPLSLTDRRQLRPRHVPVR
jgi:hypothetical protein